MVVVRAVRRKAGCVGRAAVIKNRIGVAENRVCGEKNVTLQVVASIVLGEQLSERMGLARNQIDCARGRRTVSSVKRSKELSFIEKRCA